MKNVINSLEYMTISASYHNDDGTILYINPVFCKLFKTTQKRLLDNKLSKDLMDVNILSSFNVFDFINNNISNIDNLIIKIKDKDELKIIKINSLMIKNGKDFFILLYDDITNNMSQNYIYKEIFNNIKMGIIILRSINGQDFYIKDINPYSELIDSINKDKIIDSKFSNLEFINDEIINMVKIVWRTGIKLEKNNINCSKITDIPYWKNVYVYKIDIGDIIVLYEDVTDIVETKRKFEEYDKQKTNFLSNMSHELRTPINTIVGFADLLKDVNNKKTQKDYINIIKNSAKIVSQLIDDILDITKIEEGKLNISKNNFDVNKVIDELFLTLKNNVSDIDTVKNTPFKTLKLNNDEFRFRQIFNNLISNAIKFTKNGKIEIGYKKENEHIIFYVKDTGIGIEDDNKNKIFNRFQQAKKSSKIGYGLGLTICNELIKLMGGEIWFESVIEKGSTFYFKLPNDTKLDTTKDCNIIYNVEDIDLIGKTILIVEDIDFNTKLLLSYLDCTNANIITAIDGADALIKYNENKKKLDLILMDIQIPNMDGKEVTQIIRTIDPNITIIAQTDYAMKEEINDIMDSGFNDLIKKPIKKEELFRIISKYIFKEN
jgi:signal transduction histidine kinase/ActR/RegA family two-component response regulator